MKYSMDIVINRPIDEVVNKFDNPDNYKKWMEGLQNYEVISGEPGEPGSKTKMKFDLGKRKIEMIETVILKNLPSEYTVTYDAKNVHNIVVNRFIAIEANKTKYITEQEFQFKGFMILIGLLMPSAFKKQSKKYLEAFKDFVESK